MQILFQLISIICILSIFFLRKTERKIELLIVVMICMTTFPNPIPLIGNELHRALPVVFCLSEWRNFRKYYIWIKQYKFLSYIVWIIIGLIVFLFNSPHVNSSLKDIIVYFISYLFQSYLIFPIIFCLCIKGCNMKNIYQIVYYSLLFITFWAVLNIIFHRGIFIDIMYAGRNVISYMADLGMKYSNTDRFRVQSVFLNAFNYGYINILILLFNLYCYNLKPKVLTKSKFYISLFCTLLGIYTCGCRTVLLCSIISIIVFVLLAFKLYTQIKLVLMGIIMSGFLINSQIGTVINERISSVFSDKQELGSSSLSMRESQWATVLMLTKDNIIWGNGVGYFYNDLGFNTGTSSEKSLQALEGVYLLNMLERGIIGLIYYYGIWIGFIVYILKRYKRDHLSAAFCLAAIAAYLSFAHATGELLSLLPTLVFVGIVLPSLNKSFFNNMFYNNRSYNEKKIVSDSCHVQRNEVD